MSEASDRRELLLRMYDQMFNDINRHIMVVWQSVGVLVGAFAIFALTEKQVISVDVASTLLILIAGWSLAHHLDASYWYNRNLAMIANIEKQFLVKDDLSEIHYYFGSHRPANKMITHLRIQVMLAFGIAAVVLTFHFFQRILPGIWGSWASFEFIRALPYLVGVALVVYLMRLRANRNRSYEEFISHSPGRDVDTSGVSYGEGHGFPRARKNHDHKGAEQGQSGAGPS